MSDFTSKRYWKRSKQTGRSYAIGKNFQHTHLNEPNRPVWHVAIFDEDSLKATRVLDFDLRKDAKSEGEDWLIFGS